MAESLVKKLIEYVEEKCKEKGIGPAEAIEQIMGLIANEEGEVDLSTVVSLIGLFNGGGKDAGAEAPEAPEAGEETGEAVQGPYITMLRNREAVLQQYIIDEYKDALEPGDVQMVCYTSISNEDEDLRYVLGFFSLSNYTAEGKDLKLKNYMGNVEYLVFDMDEEFNFTLAEACQAEEGDEYSSSIDALCEKLHVSREDFDFANSALERDWEEATRMMYFLENHPEYERIEYYGELKTYDEMVQISDDLFGKIMEESFALLK